MIIYPNPVRNVLSLQMNTPVEGKTNLRIKDKIGRTVLQCNDLGLYGNKSQQIPVDHLLMGQYVAQLIDDNGEVLATQRVVKQ